MKKKNIQIKKSEKKRLTFTVQIEVEISFAVD